VSHPDNPLRRLIVAVDVHRYSGRDSLAQIDIQRALIDALDKAAHAVGLDRVHWEKQQQGDGELAILPADVNEAVVVADFVKKLVAVLRRQNRSLRRESRLRIRVAIHNGMLHRGANGYPGPGPVTACRLRDAPQVKDALAAADDADLALIVSAEIFRDIVSEDYGDLRPEEFRRVAVALKEYEGEGYLWLPGSAAVSEPPAAPDASPPVSSGTQPSPTTVNHTDGISIATGATFGGGQTNYIGRTRHA
jgi:hypothetical protein